MPLKNPSSTESKINTLSTKKWNAKMQKWKSASSITRVFTAYTSFEACNTGCETDFIVDRYNKTEPPS